MTCTEIHDILSDLIDIRRGELPSGDHMLGRKPELRSEAESHLASCADCRADLQTLEDVGSAFSEFSVGELPVQHFENYGTVVRERMRREQRKIVPIGSSRSLWMKGLASAAAAACIAFTVMHFAPLFKKSKIAVARVQRAVPDVPSKLTGETRMLVTPGVAAFRASERPFSQPIPASTSNNVTIRWPNSRPDLDKLVREEGKNGFLVLGEAPGNGQPLLGLQLRTTRDEDKDLSKKDELPGLRIHDIEFGSVAHEMGLMQDDMVVCINGMKVDSGSSEDAARFLAAIAMLGKGKPVTIEVVRKERSQYVYIQGKGILGEPKTAWLLPEESEQK